MELGMELGRCPVTSDGHHGLSCKKSAGRQSRHSQINGIIHRAFLSADVLATREPTGLCTSAGVTGKRPDGITTVPWKKAPGLGRNLSGHFCYFTHSSFKYLCWLCRENCRGKENSKIFRFTSRNRLRPNSDRNVGCMGRERIRTGARTWPKNYRCKL